MQSHMHQSTFQRYQQFSTQHPYCEQSALKHTHMHADTHTHTHTDTHSLTSLKVFDVVYRSGCVCTGFSSSSCPFFFFPAHVRLLSYMLNWRQVQRKDLITFAAHYPVTVCTYLPLCVLINQAQTTPKRSSPVFHMAC